MARILNVFLEQELVGRLKQSDAGYMNFRYDPAWLQHPNRIRLSISLPLQPETFRYKDCRGFFSGLLPEAEVRKITASNFGISHENDFSLLEKIGGECAGAVTFLPPGQAPDISHPIYQPLSKNELTDMIKNLPQRPLLAGQKKVRLSLAGAQPKIAVHIQDDRISLPLNGAPSTHLLKPEHPRFQNLVWNEAFCMQLARTVGIAVPKVEVKYSDQTVYLLIKRYDRERMPNSDRLKRLHQEDFCQALGISPEFKYQREGGLSLKKCFELVERYSDIPAVDFSQLLDGIVFNYLIGNNDAHGKNFSFLYDWGSDFSADDFDSPFFNTPLNLKLRMAPLYDLVSTIQYPDLSDEMAMSIGGEYRSEAVTNQTWERFAEEIGFGKAGIKQYVLEFAERVLVHLDNKSDTQSEMEPIANAIKTRCKRVQDLLITRR